MCVNTIKALWGRPATGKSFSSKMRPRNQNDNSDFEAVWRNEDLRKRKCLGSSKSKF